jgi:hypothetical protein
VLAYVGVGGTGGVCGEGGARDDVAEGVVGEGVEGPFPLLVFSTCGVSTNVSLLMTLNLHYPRNSRCYYLLAAFL